MQPFTQVGAFTQETRDAIANNIRALEAGSGFRKVYYVDVVNGRDTNDGSIDAPLQTLSVAYGLCVAGKNDAVAIIGDGTTTASVRLSANFTWAKNATHLIGLSSGTRISGRARIAPLAGVAAFANFFTVSANGCLFKNIQWFHGFDTGGAAQICLTVTGGRNRFENCHIAGMGDTASGNSATSRSLKISGTGENQFDGCVIGLDTALRSAANASVEFAGGAPRNVFRDCYFPFFTDDATVLGIIVAAAAGSDRFQFFDSCVFINAIKSTSTAMDALATLAASMGGLLLFKYCTLVGITEYGTDATSRAQVYVDGGTVTAATTGIAVNPT